jgi:putative SOS response-associated peptidase YedK
VEPTGRRDLDVDVLNPDARRRGPGADVHDRMPVILPEEAQPAWVDPRQTGSEKALALAQEKAVTALQHYPVSTRVNNAKNEGAD